MNPCDASHPLRWLMLVGFHSQIYLLCYDVNFPTVFICKAKHLAADVHFIQSLTKDCSA